MAWRLQEREGDPSGLFVRRLGGLFADEVVEVVVTELIEFGAQLAAEHEAVLRRIWLLRHVLYSSSRWSPAPLVTPPSAGA